MSLMLLERWLLSAAALKRRRAAVAEAPRAAAEEEQPSTDTWDGVPFDLDLAVFDDVPAAYRASCERMCAGGRRMNVWMVCVLTFCRHLTTRVAGYLGFATVLQDRVLMVEGTATSLQCVCHAAVLDLMPIPICRCYLSDSQSPLLGTSASSSPLDRIRDTVIVYETRSRPKTTN